MREIYGELADNREFATAFADALEMVWDRGAEAAMTHYIEGR